MDTAVGFKTLTVIGLSLWRSDIIAAGGGLDKGLKCCKTSEGGLSNKSKNDIKQRFVLGLGFHFQFCKLYETAFL